MYYLRKPWLHLVLLLQHLYLTIQNTGTADLTGITISKSGIHQGEFTINGAPTAITAGQTATFTVTFAPANGGLRTFF